MIVIKASEWEMMKNQHISYAEENDRLNQELKTLTTQISELPSLQNKLQSEEQKNKKIKEEYDKVEDELSQKVYQASIAAPRAVHDPEMISNLNHVNEELKKLFDVEAHWAEVVAHLAVQLENERKNIKLKELCMSKLSIWPEKLTAVVNQNLNLIDLSTKRDELQTESLSLTGRKNKLIKWKQQAETTTANLRNTLIGLEDDKSKADVSLSKSEIVLEDIKKSVQQAERKKNDLFLQVSQHTLLKNKQKEEFQKEVKLLTDNINIKRKELKQNIFDVNSIQSVITNYSGNNKKTVKKNNELISQLEKRIKEEIDNLPPVPESVIESVLNDVQVQMEKKTSLEKEIEKLELSLEYFQLDFEKKSFLAEKFSKIVPSYEPEYDVEVLLGNVEEVFESSSQENYSLVEALKSLNIEVTRLEKEQTSIKKMTV